MQYHFLFHGIRKYKRPYVKWGKNIKEEKAYIVMRAFDCSHRKAIEYLKILGDDDLNNIINTLDEGGVGE